MMAVAKVLRGPLCPFILRRGSMIHYVPSLPPEMPMPPRTGIVATGSVFSDGTFEWRGRRRRNVPGG